MEILNFIFRIGVILAVYNFLWWLILLGVNLLRGGKSKQLFDVYFIKTVRYVFLADVVFLFSIEQAGGLLLVNDFLIGGLILLIYFVGKIQAKQDRKLLFSMNGRASMPGVGEIFKRLAPVFDIRIEFGVVVFSLLVYCGFYFFPDLAANNISNWFLSSILNIEDTPVFGFVFKVVGFFFMVSVLIKITNGLLSVFNVNRDNRDDREGLNNDFFGDREDEDDHFDDYTEVK